ncbi:MAG: peroxide stress protein YaaA [Actinomycetes bacterium]
MTPPVVLLPPSEGKAIGGRRGSSAGTFGRLLSAERGVVLEGLGRSFAAASAQGSLSKMLGVRGELLGRAIESTEALLEGRAKVLPAWQRYDGVVWGHLGPGDLDTEIRRRVLVPSGLYGLTTAEDPIADYRLKMSIRLEETGPLHRFWSTAITAAIGRRFRGETIVDLLPQEHAAAIDYEKLERSVHLIRITFLAAGGVQAAGHDAKAAKGAVARHLLTEGLGGFEDFAWRGWSVTVTEGGYALAAPG